MKVSSLTRRCGMGIYTHTTQTGSCSSKTSCYDLYRCSTAAPTRGTAATHHCYENSWYYRSSGKQHRSPHEKRPNFFTLSSVFRNLGLYGKLVLRAIQPSQEQALRLASASVVLMCFSHVSTWVRLV